MPVRPGAFTTPAIGEFGAWRKHGRHNGWDQYAFEGTPIYAAGDGVVIKIAHNPDPNLGFGHNVTVRMDADRYEILEAHMLTAPSVRLGERVTSATRVGYVGKSGNAVRVGSHDHVQIRKPNGLIVNPREYLATLAPSGLKPKPLHTERRKTVTTNYVKTSTGDKKGGAGSLWATAGDAGSPCPGNWLEFTRTIPADSLFDRGRRMADVHGNAVMLTDVEWDAHKKLYATPAPVGSVALDASALIAELRALGVKIDALPAEIDRYADGKKQS